MDRETCKRLYRAAKRLGYTDDKLVTVRKDYSGRGMFGNTTYALIVPNFAYIAAMAAAARVKKTERENFAEEVRGLGSDSMGRSSIVVY